MGQIYLVRHGQASFGSDDYDQLSELGLEQARLLGEWLANSPRRFHRIVTGGMRRHRQTADACIARLPKAHLTETDWHTDPGFNEYDHHEVLVRYRPEFADMQELGRFLASNAEPKRAFQKIFGEAVRRWMGGQANDYTESWPAFQARCVGALQRLIDTGDKSQSIIVFTSGGTIAAICQHVLGLADRQAAELSWSLVNCSVTKLLYNREGIGLGYLNNYAHLEWLGQPHTITYR